MTDKEKELIAEYTEFILMGYDKGMRISMAKIKDKKEKEKVEYIYKQFMSSVINSMEAFADIKEAEADRKGGAE